MDRELYLPKSWTDDRDRCRGAKVPDQREFATKNTLAATIVRRALASPLPIAWSPRTRLRIGYAAERGEVDLSLVSVDSATSRAHHHAAGMVLDEEQLKALVEAAESEKGAGRRDKSRKTNRTETRNEPSGGGCGDAAGRV